MPQIKILSDILANQIAAGEVVERPASIVKELIENSLDAKASKITVKFKNGGKSFIIVEDNGYGMTPDDALLCLERHATSKIKDIHDLNAITTFGFRGEAIPSIASISRFTLKTRSENHTSGTEILVSGGKRIHQKDIGMPTGTTIEVANLFNTIPVRRKFLKTENTESAHIIHTVRLYALSFPSISFTLFENDRLVFKTSSTKNLLERINEAWSQKTGNSLLPLNAEEGSLKLSGFIGSPDLYRSTKHELLTFVNNRPVDSKTLYYAFIESYHTYIPKSRFPVIFAFLEINPSLIDVNVHPSKREIKFRQEPIVRQFIIQNVLKTLSSKNSHPSKFNFELGMKPFSDKRLEEAPSILPTTKPLHPKDLKAEPPTPSAASLPPPTIPQEDLTTSSPPKIDLLHSLLEPEECKRSQNNAFWCEESKAHRSTGSERIDMRDDPSIGAIQLSSTQMGYYSAVPPQFSSLDWRVLNILQNGYALLESNAGIIVFNYRGAHHRVCYEKLLKEFQHQAPVAQPLLIPIPLELTNLENEAFLKGKKLFEKLGFMLAPFGRNYYRIESIPALLENTDAHQLVKNMISLLLEEAGDPLKHIFVQKIIQLSSFQAMTTTNTPTDTIILNLLEQLMHCDNPFTCPRGYPIYTETTYSELDKKFGR